MNQTVIPALFMVMAALAASESAFAKIVYKGSAAFVVKQERVREFLSAVQKIVAPTRKEPGNICYEAFRVLNDKGEETNRFEFHELWISEKAMMIDYKERAPHMKEFFRTVRVGEPDGMVKSFEVSGHLVEEL